jgi:adenylate cyclase
MLQRWAMRLIIGTVVFVIFLANTSGLVHMRLLSQIENLTYDFLVRSTLIKTVDPRVVVVDIDEKSIAEIGQWPWRRDRLAEMLDRLFDQYHVRVVGFDVVFPEADRRSGIDVLDRLAAGPLADDPLLQSRLTQLHQDLDTDARFAQSLRGRPIVLGFAFRSYVGLKEAPEAGTLCDPVVNQDQAKLYAVDFIEPKGFSGLLPEHRVEGWSCGFFDNPILDEDGVYRRVPLVQEYQGRLYASLPLAMMRLAQVGASGGKDAAISLEFDPPEMQDTTHLESVRVGQAVAPVGNHVAVYVPYRGVQYSFPYVPATDVINGRADASTLKDAFVLVGTTAAGLLDQRTTPVMRNYAGVEVHANIISGLLDGRIRQKAPYYNGIETIMLLLLTLVMSLVLPRLSPFASAGLAVGLGIAVFGLAFGLWQGANFIIPLGVPLTFIVAQFMAQQLYGYFVESRRSREISRRFGQYVPPEIVEEMAANPEQVSMETEDRQMTVLFSDIRGFTTISEQFRDRPQELSKLMNEFLGPLTEVVFRNRGTIDKYMGDAIMAFWGAPLKTEDHALQALRAAMEFPKALRKLDATFESRGWPKLHIGVGLNTGNMRVGNMGSEFRIAYTVLGDTVNQASRFESLTKVYGVDVICGEATRAAAADWAFRELDRVRVKGKNEPVAIYEPLGPRDALDASVTQDLSRHRQALRAYRNRLWDEAERDFFSLSRSGQPHPIYELYLARIAHFRQHPPPPDWDGSFSFEHK